MLYEFECGIYATDPNHPARHAEKKVTPKKSPLLGPLLWLLSFCTYPALLGVAPDQHQVWHGVLATDIFMYFRAILLCVGAAFLLPNAKKPTQELVCYLILLAISVVNSPHIETVLLGSPNYYEGAVTLLAYAAILLQGEVPELALEWAVYTAFGLAALQLLYGCYFLWPPIRALMPADIGFEYARLPLFSSFGNPNHLGLFCATLLPFFLSRLKPLPSLMLIAMLLGSHTRGAWVSAVATTLIRFRREWRIALPAIALALFLVWPRVLVGVHSLHWPIRDSDLDSRAYIWSETIPMLKRHWIAGSGPGTFAVNFPQFTERARGLNFGKTVIDRPHNMYLYTWYATGFLSLIALGALVLRFFHRCTDPALRMGVLGYLLAGLFTDSVVSVTPYFMAMLGAGLYNKRFTKQEMGGYTS